MTGARMLLDILFAGVWQGAIVACVTAVGLALAGRRIGAATRYAVLELAMLALVLVPLATTAHAGSTASIALLPLPGSDANAAAAPIASAGFFARRIDLALDDRLVLAIDALWLGIAALLVLRLVAGSLRLARIVHRATPLGRRDGVRVLASRDVGVPMAIGFADPCVVVPISLTSADARGELECALLHELAHVRRKDAWINAGDRILHAGLFFNPAAQYLLHRISLERETACDDWAVAQSRDLDGYTRGLATIAVRAAGASNAPFGAVGFGRSTLARIERLDDSRRNGTITLSRFTIGGFLIVLAIIAILLQSFAPAVAFSGSGSTASQPAVVASNTCIDAGARVLTAAPPSFPDNAPKLNQPVSAQITVNVSATGKFKTVKIYKSSGYAVLDKAAIDAAMASTYEPATHNCKPVDGSYLFQATFAPN